MKLKTFFFAICLPRFVVVFFRRSHVEVVSPSDAVEDEDKFGVKTVVVLLL